MNGEFDKAAYDQAYMKKNTVVKMIRFGRETDAAMLAYLESKPEGFSKYIRRLIEADMRHTSQPSTTIDTDE